DHTSVRGDDMRLRKPIALSLALGLAALLDAQVWPRTAWGQEELFVADYSSDTITAYSRTAKGNTGPTRTLSGPATLLRNPYGLFVDTGHKELVVGNDGNNSITVYNGAARLEAAPIRTLSGPATGLGIPRLPVVDTVHDELVVANYDNHSITVYRRTA